MNAMTNEEREFFRGRLLMQVQDTIRNSNRQRYLDKANELRAKASEEEGETAMELMAEATRYELFADMLRDPRHSMWECIALHKLKQSETPTPRPIPKRRPTQYVRDSTLGYNRVAGIIHHPKQARLFFK
jgi:hypothetical protein